MKHKIVKEIVKLVYDIYNLDFDITDFKQYDKLRTLTKEVWEEYHRELLSELSNLKPKWNVVLLKHFLRMVNLHMFFMDGCRTR